MEPLEHIIGTCTLWEASGVVALLLQSLLLLLSGASTSTLAANLRDGQARVFNPCTLASKVRGPCPLHVSSFLHTT